MSGPRFIPFEAMTSCQMREHLQRMHAGSFTVYGPDERLLMRAYHSIRDDEDLPHTHDKPVQR